MSDIPKICVIMSTFNGEKYIKEQITSIINQKGVKVALVIRDDGSTDNTLLIEKAICPKDSKIIAENNIGVANSFWEALSKAGHYDYYAWADQDDIWDLDKLKVAVERIRKYDNLKPILYFCGNRTVNKSGKLLTENIDSNPSVTLQHALINSSAQGATMVFNSRLRELALLYKPNFEKLNILHDAWMHKVCLTMSGKVIYDPRATLSYRIHEKNVEARVATKSSFIQKINNKMKKRSPNYYSNVASELINGYDKIINSDERRKIDYLANYRKNKYYKIILILGKELSSGEKKRDIAFKLNVIFNKA